MAGASSFWERLGAAAERLASPRTAWFAAMAGVLLSATCIGRHLALDDYVLFLAAQGSPQIPGFVQDDLNLFTFCTGHGTENWQLMDQGFLLPWWSDPQLKVALWRPLSSLTHRLDLLLWPQSAPAMYVHSLLWFGLLLALCGALYKRQEQSAKLAGLSALLYAFDDAHGPAVSWLANRNALIATAFGVLSLILHDRFRREGRVALGIAAPLCLLAGMLGGEFALGAVGYLIGYALFLERGSLFKRALTLWPYAAVLVCWRVVYGALDFGAHGSGAYVDPARDPVGFVTVLPQKLAVLLHGALSFPPSDLVFIGVPSHRPLLITIAFASVLVAALLLAPIIRREPLARYWAFGAVLAAIPVSASFPSDRLLFFVGLGVMPLLARLFSSWLQQRREARPLGVPGALIAGFALLHLVLAPAFLPARSRQMQVLGGALETAYAGLPSGPALTGRTLVLLGPPVEFFASYIQAERALRGVARPEHVYWLASATSRLSIERSATNAVTVEPQEGFLYTPLERHYRGDPRSLPVGSRVKLSELTAEVTDALPDGRPKRVRFEFRNALEHEQYLFYRWNGRQYERVALPALGGKLTIEQQDIGKILLEAS